MIIRNGIRSILRSGKLCSLFFILTALLSVLLSLGTGVYAAAQATLKSFDETYRTVGRLEYIGSDYPDETAADMQARDAFEKLDMSAFMGTEGVISAEKKQYAPGFTAGFKRHRGTIPYKDYGVLTVTSVHPLESQLTDIPLEEAPDLPDVCIVTDAITRAVTVYSYGTQHEIPAFEYDRANDEFTRLVSQDGKYITEALKPGELPQEYILYSHSGQALQIQYDGPVDLEDHELTRYKYNPDDGSYVQQIYAVSEYTCIFKDALYSRKEKRNILIRLRTGLMPFEPDEKKTYLVHGSFVPAETSNLVFELRDFKEDGPQPWLDVTGMDSEELQTTIFAEYADSYRQANNYLNVYSGQDISLLEPFHQGWLTLAQGRFPSPGEDHACVIDSSLADQLGLTVGDSLPLQLMTPETGNIYSYSSAGTAEDYVITGITAENNDYHGEVFITDGDFSSIPFFGYQLGTILFENETARAAAEEIRPLLGSQVRLTVYDQGYETNSQPLKALRTTALIITLICVFAALSVLTLFAYLYIYRQKETIGTLHRLGLTSVSTAVWMLAGILAIVLAGSLAGTLIGTLLQRRIISLTIAGTASLYAMDTRYSEAAAGLIKEVTPVMPSSWLSGLISIILIALCASLLGIFFLRLAMRQERPSKGKQKMKVPHDTTSVSGNGIVRYGKIAFERGGSRSAAVILITFVLSLLLCGFSAMADGWQEELDELYENAEISGGIVSLNGRYSSDLVINESTVRLFNQSGLIDTFHVSCGLRHYWLENEMPAFAETSFGEESRAAWIAQQPRLIASDSLEAAEDFFYTPAVIQWAEGYDEAFLGEDRPLLSDEYEYDEASRSYHMKNPCPALAPDRWLNEHGYQAGDVFEVMITGDNPVLLKIAGTYAQTGSKANIYVPLASCYELKYLTEEREDNNSWYSYRYENVYTTGRFKLKSARQLSAFKDFLSANRFSQVNKPAYDRTTVLLNDAAFLDTLSTLNRHIAFARMIYPVLMAFTILIGFLISWLMINGRRMDFAVMKGLGAGRLKVFLIFFNEQAYSAAAGILPSLLLSFAIGSPVIILLFAAAYLAGTAVSIILASRENLMVLLSEKE